MHTFNDTRGREWRIEINVAAVKKLRASPLKIDLIEIESGLLDRLASDPILLVDMLYVLCQEQAESAGVSDEDFGRALAGEAIERATAVFLEELADFFPNPAKRRALKGIVAKTEAVAARVVEMVDREMEKLTPERILDVIAGGTSTSSPGSSGSTPTP